MKTVLVTGGSGFIGYNLANALYDKGYKVTVIDRTFNNYKSLYPDINFMLGDIRKVEFSKSYDFVYHLAAVKSPAFCNHSEEIISTNVWGTYNFIRSFQDSRFIFTSSFDAAEAKSIHGITKKSAEHFVNLHKNAVSVRFMNVYGEKQVDPEMDVPAFCCALKNNKKAIIKGSNKLYQEYIYVLDLVDELIKLGESHIKGQTETGYGVPISPINLYKLIASIAKKKENYRYESAKDKDLKNSNINIKYKIREPRFGLTEGLRRTLKWYLEEETL